MKYSLELLVALQRIQTALDIYDLRNERRGSLYKRNEKRDETVNQLRQSIKAPLEDFFDKTILHKISSVEKAQPKKLREGEYIPLVVDSLQQALESYGTAVQIETEKEAIDEILSHNEGRTAITVLDRLTDQKVMKETISKEYKKNVLDGDEEDFEERISTQIKAVKKLIDELTEMQKKVSPSGRTGRASDLHAILANGIAELNQVQSTLSTAVADNLKKKLKQQEEKHQKEMKEKNETHGKEISDLKENHIKDIDTLKKQMEGNQKTEKEILENQIKEKDQKIGVLEKAVSEHAFNAEKHKKAADHLRTITHQEIGKNVGSESPKLEDEKHIRRLEEKIEKLEKENKVKDEIIESLMSNTRAALDYVVDLVKSILFPGTEKNQLLADVKKLEGLDAETVLTQVENEKLKVMTVMAQAEKETKISPKSSPKEEHKKNPVSMINSLFSIFKKEQPKTDSPLKGEAPKPNHQ